MFVKWVTNRAETELDQLKILSLSSAKVRGQIKAWFILRKDFRLTLKAETHDATNRYDASPRQVAPTNRLVWHVKIIDAATEFVALVWICATYRSDKLSASDLSQQQCRRGDLSPRRVAAICRIVCLGLYTSLAKFYASNFIQTLFSLSASFGFHSPPLLTFKIDWLDFRGLDQG